MFRIIASDLRETKARFSTLLYRDKFKYISDVDYRNKLSRGFPTVGSLLGNSEGVPRVSEGFRVLRSKMGLIGGLSTIVK